MKNKNNLIGIVGIAAIILIAGVALAISKNNNAPHNTTANLISGANVSLAASERNYDFGMISMARGEVSRKFKIKNQNPNAVLIEKIYTSCMCTEAVLEIGGKRRGPFGMPGHGLIPKISQLIMPGEEAEVQVIFDPAAHGPSGVGPIDRVVYIDGENGRLLELGIKAVVTP